MSLQQIAARGHVTWSPAWRKKERGNGAPSLSCWQLQAVVHFFVTKCQWLTRWWFPTFLIFTPTFREDSQFEEHIFQMGW